MVAGSAGRTGIALTEKQRIAWLRLIRSDNVGPSTFRDLIQHYGSAEAALAALPDLSQRGGATRVIRIASEQDALRELEAVHRFGARFVGIGEPGYPQALKEIDGAPPLLTVKGNLSMAVRPAIGIVGSRNASISGAKFAAMITRACGEAGYAVISGLARGIDTAAHRASLQTGTIAAMAGGLDQPYPPENVGLLNEIWDGNGLAVSEMPFGWEPRARDFPRRNRLIAGISLGLVVVEAATRSGSLITARLAGEFGRLVFAVPGSPLDPRCEGTNGLLKDGAIIVTRPEDIVEALRPLAEPDLFRPQLAEAPVEKNDKALSPPPDDTDRDQIVDALGPTPVEIDDIIRHTGASVSSVHSVLLELDMAGRLHRHPGGLVSISMLD
ncbi:DNA-protecting protein DprA [Agrobacterium rhizogenes]|uniref:DNA protecting protein DprA n=1 Tax=Rhizobium rhizogenes (strain K84 / ATCC BAA-868) TaxID=311403 RepID=B9JDL7_RHIR8|nr:MULTISPECIES: DNA-processing protein DprA [Rhizobium]ACM26218.1 DNA protecting protein DprA [Rhizobium rhizogenes K84]OCJ25303.1 DNA protecting protein DprA [Agrobacterium sp. B131/95]OCJ31542.1 DNA protecting protein DprA [Agrobacterium sp. B133/95]EJK86346.1 DNA protecting protein DprA [Rhizobium sp. AP16]MDJ1632567.1 DNA-processing protein DprA [Rhizobium rhizogenes]